MALRINTNVAALNAHRNLQITEKSMNSNMARLSSGYRINSAADDAAGLSIANRLRTNVRSLTVASQNVTEGKALVSVAEGAGNQVESILERLKELATQAASDNAGTDRSKINSEASKLIEEIDRIVNSTTYQGSSLLKGAFGNAVSATGGTAITGLTSTSFAVSGASDGTYTITGTAGTTITATAATGDVQVLTLDRSSGAQTINFSKLGIVINADSTFANAANTMTVTVTAGSCGGLFQVGSGSTLNTDTIGVSLGNMTSTALAINNLSLTTGTSARSAMSTIDSAIDTVNSVLGGIGAAMNRFDYTYSNLQVSIENFNASQSAIRDVDMASEMVSFTKNQILMQAGTAMLAQANTSSQSILSLMQ